MRQIKNIRLPQPLNSNGEDFFWTICVDHSNIIRSIKRIENHLLLDGEDWLGDWLSPMGVDLQINGGLGVAFSDLHFEQLPSIYALLDKLWLDGVEAICPTIVTSNICSLRKSLEVIRVARENTNQTKSCKLLGAHLEGPFLSRKFKGAHELQYISDPSISEIIKRIQGFEDEISLVTLAPELKGAGEVIEFLRKNQILVSLGHSSASDEECKAAFNSGVSMITHAFNAMNGIHHRAPGPIVEAMVNENISVGLIADGTHIHPHIAIMLQKLFPTQLFLVSDALPLYGINAPKCFWNNQIINVDKGVCFLDDGTLAGTSLSLLEGCKNLAKWTQNISFSIWTATVSPRIAMNPGKKIEEFLLEKPLHQLLRWSFQKDTANLYWEHAK